MEFPVSIIVKIITEYNTIPGMKFVVFESIKTGISSA